MVGTFGCAVLIYLVAVATASFLSPLDQSKREESGLDRIQLATELAYLTVDSSHKNKVTNDYLQTIDWYRYRSVRILGETEEVRDMGRIYMKHCKDGPLKTELEEMREMQMVEPAEPNGYRDLKETALFQVDKNAWEQKSECKYCALVFAPEDDKVDAEHIKELGVTSFCGMPGVHNGYASEAEGYIEKMRMRKLLSVFTPENCGKVMFAGHSMGGAVASLMAFCANEIKRPLLGYSGFNVFDRREDDVQLFTYGAPAVSKKPLYNNEPGVPFQGERFTVGHNALSAITPYFGNEAVKLCARLMKHAERFDEWDWLKAKAKTLIEKSQKDHIDVWRNQLQEVNEKLGFIQATIIETAVEILSIEKPDETLLEQPLKLYYDLFDFLTEHRKGLLFEYDPMPSLSLSRNLVHPAIRIRYITHPIAVSKNYGLEAGGVDDFVPDMVFEPMWSPLRSIFGMVAHQHFHAVGGVTNHAICCYIQGLKPTHKLCPKRFAFDGSVVCNTQQPANYR